MYLCTYVCKHKALNKYFYLIHHNLFHHNLLKNIKKNMATKKRQVIRLLLFIGMVFCFSLQSMTSFKKFLNEKTSLSVSYVKKGPEPLPTFSICSKPPFNHEYLKKRNMSANFFLSSYQLRLLKALYWSITQCVNKY